MASTAQRLRRATQGWRHDGGMVRAEGAVMREEGARSIRMSAADREKWPRGG